MTMESHVIMISDPGLLNPGARGWDGVHPTIYQKPPSLWGGLLGPPPWGPSGPRFFAPPAGGRGAVLLMLQAPLEGA